jgi:DNA polymerase-1
MRFWAKNGGALEHIPGNTEDDTFFDLEDLYVDRTFITDEFGLQKWFFDRDVTTCAFDTESISEDPDKEKGALDFTILHWVGASFCNGSSTCYVDLDVADREKMIEFLAYQFANKIEKLVGWNLQYDMMVLYKYGIQHTEQIFCGMVAAHLLDENGSKSLKENTYRYLPYRDVVKYKDVESKGHHSFEFYDYGADDAENTWLLFKKQYKWLTRDKLTYCMFKVEMPFQYCLRDMHINGMLIDMTQLQSIEDQMRPIILEAEDKMLEMLGKKAHIEKAFWEDLDVREVSINFNSSHQVIPILMDKFGIELTELTDTGIKRQRDGLEVGDKYYKLDKIVLGGHELDKGIIGGLAAECEFCKQLLIFKMAKGIADGFTKKMKKHISPDGRIRCSFNDCIAATGRLSSSEPNLQNLRKLNAVLGVECRSCFIAPEGKTLIAADFAGQELRILAFVTQDPTLLDAFRKGLDLHLVTANLLFDLGLTEEELTDGTDAHAAASKKYGVERHKAKNGFNFPVVYGSTEIGISNGIGVSVEEAKVLLDKFLDTYPGIADGIEDCNERIRLYKYVTNSAGRRRRFPEGFSNRASRQAFNFLIQGYAADMLRLAMAKVLKDVILVHPEWEMKFVLTVHDEVVLEVLEEYADEAKDEVYKAMCSAVDLGIPVECSVGVGKK